jgi:nucleoside-diphosphate-sugar epimerase
VTILLLYLAYAVTLAGALARAGYRSRAVSTDGAACPRPRKVLIVGATGGTGRQLVTQAHERDYEVTAFVRDPARLRIAHPRLTVVRGDVLDTVSVEAAMRGQEAVLSALGHNRYYSPARVMSEGTRNILSAMEKHGVARFVCETSLGIGDSAGRLGLLYALFIIPVILPLYFWDKTRQERLIAASGAAAGTAPGSAATSRP